MALETGVFKSNTQNIAEAYAVIERVKAYSKWSYKCCLIKSAKFDLKLFS